MPNSILMICPVFRPFIGGSERAAERLSLKLVQRGYQVTVVTLRRDERSPKSEDLHGVKIERLGRFPPLGTRFGIIIAYIQLAVFLLVRGRRFKVWHVHQHGVYAAIVIAVSRFVKRPVVMKVSSTGKNGLLSLNRGITERTIRQADACNVTSTEAYREAILFGIPKERVFLIGNGIDTLKFRILDAPVNRDKLKADLGLESSQYALFVGRLVKEKNPLGLIDAWNIACSKLPANWKLLVVGDGPFFGELSALVEKLGLMGRVSLVGAKQDVVPWLQIADLFIVSSDVEGLSNACLEAMSCGLPVVSTNVSGSEDTITRSGCGCVVEVGNTEQLANAIVQFATDENSLRSCGHRGRKLIEKEYSIEVVADRISKVYADLSR